MASEPRAPSVLILLRLLVRYTCCPALVFSLKRRVTHLPSQSNAMLIGRWQRDV